MACDGSAVDRVGDDREDVVDLGAEEGQGHEGNDDNQRDDKGVLGEALSALVAAVRLTHGAMLAVAPAGGEPRWANTQLALGMKKRRPFPAGALVSLPRSRN